MDEFLARVYRGGVHFRKGGGRRERERQPAIVLWETAITIPERAGEADIPSNDVGKWS